MPNRLARSTSPYLRQHQDNPVDWYIWGEEAFAEARRRDVPILLSVGYSACHWCHVMAHESFEDPVTAEQMNSLFVNVKVDREERPDVDAVYMEAVQALSGRGGWPMTVWLTPDGRPFYAGTYFPSQPHSGMPSFRSVLTAIDDAWNHKREDIHEQADRLTEAIGRSIPSGERPGQDAIDGAYRQLVATYDHASGGFGGAPKFPQQPVLEFLLRVHEQDWAPEAGRMLAETLVAMARGGIYDQVGGGFARYSVDSVWLVPHFEKMLYDNAQLVRLYLWASREFDNDQFRTIALETIDYLKRDLRHPGGGFFSAEDADSEGVEGKFYVWTASEFDAVVGSDARMARRFFGVTDGGNFEGSNILHVDRTITEIAEEFGATVESVTSAIDRARTALFDARRHRVRPGLDHKVVASWNGLAIRALAEAGAALDRPDLIEDATRCARFVLGNLSGPDGRVRRSWSEGAVSSEGFLEDQAAMALGLLRALSGHREHRVVPSRRTPHAVDPTPLCRSVGRLLHHRRGRRSPHQAPQGSVRQPAAFGKLDGGRGASLALSATREKSNLAQLADQTLQAGSLLLERYPSGAGYLASVLASKMHGTVEVAVIGPEAHDFIRAFWSRYRPQAVLAASADGSEPIPLLGATGGQDATAAFVCHDFVCERPVTSPEAMEALLRPHSA